METESYSIEAEDRHLIEEILASGSEHAKRALYDRYVNRIYRQCRSYGGLSREDAEDIVQDVFFTAYTQFASLEDPEKFASWLHAITRNRCLKILKDRSRRAALEKGYKAECLLHLASPDDYLMREQEVQIIHDLIDSVENKKHRETVECFYIRGMSCEEIANKQKIKVTTVTSRLSRFRARIQRQLMRRVVELRSR